MSFDAMVRLREEQERMTVWCRQIKTYIQEVQPEIWQREQLDGLNAIANDIMAAAGILQTDLEEAVNAETMAASQSSP